jgi:hypothetical protein
MEWKQDEDGMYRPAHNASRPDPVTWGQVGILAMLILGLGVLNVAVINNSTANTLEIIVFQIMGVVNFIIIGVYIAKLWSSGR